MARKFNSLEASFYQDLNSMVRKSWMSVELGLMNIMEGLCVKRLD